MDYNKWLGESMASSLFSLKHHIIKEWGRKLIFSGMRNGYNPMACNEVETQPKIGIMPRVNTCFHFYLGTYFPEVRKKIWRSIVSMTLLGRRDSEDTKEPWDHVPYENPTSEWGVMVGRAECPVSSLLSMRKFHGDKVGRKREGRWRSKSRLIRTKASTKASSSRSRFICWKGNLLHPASPQIKNHRK